MNFNITNKDRKRAKNTSILMAVLFAVFAVLSVVFICLTPNKHTVKSLGENQELIKSQAEGATGDDFFMLSETTIYRYDAFDNELISTFSFSAVSDLMQKKGETLMDGSLYQWSMTYVGDGEQAYYVLYDVNGNFFKLKDDGKNLILTEDYLLSTNKREIKGSDNVGGDFYVLLTENSRFRVDKYDVADLASGVKARKILWEINDEAEEEDGVLAIKPMNTSTGILGFYAVEDVLYVVTGGGNVFKISTTLADCVVDGKAIDYFSIIESDYAVLYEEYYAEHFRDLLLKAEQTTYTQEQIENADKQTLVSYYGALFADKLKKAQTDADTKAKSSAATAAEKNNKKWCDDYKRNRAELYVKEDYVDTSCYATLISGENSISGIVYSKKSEAFYYTNDADGYLYSVEKSAVDNARHGDFLSNIDARIDAVKCGDNQKFYNFGNGLSINEFANTLYLRFNNERIVSIVDINDKSNYKVVHTFEGDFDIYHFTGDKDNSVTHVLRQVSKVDLDGTRSTELHASTYNPALFAKKTLIRTMMIVFLCLTAICLGVCLWFFAATKNDVVLNKVKIIQRDFQKNKYIYLALVGFIVLLIMFCYYEAIGAISMSFFDYTREKPAWIWNNFGNYLRIFNQPNFWLSVRNMLFFLVTDLFFCIVPPLIFAFLLVLIRNKKVSGWIRSLMFIPGIIPSIATMLIWRIGIYGDDGILNQLIGFFGGEKISFLHNTDYAMGSLIFMGFPFVGGYLIFYGGMMNIPEEYHEAGRLEGLGVIKRLLLIDIPLIMPQIKYIFIMTFIESVQNYARTFILGSSGTVTVVESMYRIMMGTQADYGMASAYATIIFAFLFVAVATNFKMQTKETMGEDL